MVSNASDLVAYRSSTIPHISRPTDSASETVGTIILLKTNRRTFMHAAQPTPVQEFSTSPAALIREWILDYVSYDDYEDWTYIAFRHVASSASAIAIAPMPRPDCYEPVRVRQDPSSEEYAEYPAVMGVTLVTYHVDAVVAGIRDLVERTLADVETYRREFGDEAAGYRVEEAEDIAAIADALEAFGR